LNLDIYELFAETTGLCDKNLNQIYYDYYQNTTNVDNVIFFVDYSEIYPLVHYELNPKIIGNREEKEDSLMTRNYLNYMFSKRSSGYGKLCLLPVYFIESLHSMKRCSKLMSTLSEKSIWEEYISISNNFEKKMAKRFLQLSPDKIITGTANQEEILEFNQFVNFYSVERFFDLILDLTTNKDMREEYYDGFTRYWNILSDRFEPLQEIIEKKDLASITINQDFKNKIKKNLASSDKRSNKDFNNEIDALAISQIYELNKKTNKNLFTLVTHGLTYRTANHIDNPSSVNIPLKYNTIGRNREYMVLRRIILDLGYDIDYFKSILKNKNFLYEKKEELPEILKKSLEYADFISGKKGIKLPNMNPIETKIMLECMVYNKQTLPNLIRPIIMKMEEFTDFKKSACFSIKRDLKDVDISEMLVNLKDISDRINFYYSETYEKFSEKFLPENGLKIPEKVKSRIYDLNR
jgi:hypothetical protein